MGDKYGCCVGERMAGFLPMSLTTSVAIPMDVAPRTRNNAQRRARAWFCPRRKARHCVWRGGGGVAAGCTGNDRWQDPPILSGGRRQQDKLGPDQEKARHTHTGQQAHGERRTLTSVLSLYLGVGCRCRAADASLDCHLRSCQYDRSLQT